MLIQPEHRAVWLHNPKCAGMSVADWLCRLHGYQPVVDDLEAKYDAADPLSPVWRHAWVAPDECRTWWTWCVVRHPAARWGSFWNYIRKWHPHFAEIGFGEFTKRHCDWLPPQIRYTASCSQWIRFEALESGLQRLGFGQVRELPRINTTGTPVPWTDEALEVVRRHFAKDFDALGYAHE